MANSITIISASITGDAITVEGTVNGTPVTVQVWQSHLQTLGTQAAKKQYVAQQLVAQLPQTVDLTSQLSGSLVI